MAAVSTVPLARQRFAVLDVETSGLSSRRHRILQIAVVTALGDGTIVDEWSSDVRPRWRRVGPHHVHGLTARRLRSAPRFHEIVPDLVAHLDGAVLVAHNVGFDWAFVRRGLARAGYPAAGEVLPNPRRLCTLVLSRTLDPDGEVGSHRLAELCRRHGVDLVNAHDALADARATAAVLPHLLARAGAASLDDLTPAVWGHSTAWPAPVVAAPQRWRRRSAPRGRQPVR